MISDARCTCFQVDDLKMSPEELKAALIDSFWGTERGLSATADTRAEINELITQLEAANTCNNPTDVSSLSFGFASFPRGHLFCAL
jgi:PAP_fibrillin